MSKLDDIFDQYMYDCFLAKDTGLNKSASMLALSGVAHKLQIKELMLELHTIAKGQAELEAKNSDLLFRKMIEEL